MPRTTFPKDRFDELPADVERVGAHRAENPRLRGGVMFFWAFVSVLVLVAAGIFGTLVVTGRIALFPAPEAAQTEAPPQVVAPVVDTSYPVLILNATTQRGLAGQLRDTVIAAGWNGDSVDAGDAASQDFETTTVYYPAPEHEAAARGLADVIGGAEVAVSDQFPGTTSADGAVTPQLTIVIGADRATEEAPAGE